MPSASRNATIACSSHGSTRSATAPVSRLNSTCAAAARRALAVAPSAAMTPVRVVPRLAPITTAAAASSGSMPPSAAVRVMASAALDDCTSAVMTAPAITWAMIISAPLAAGSANPAAIPVNASFRKSMPRKSRPDPASAMPSAPRRLPGPLRCSSMPAPISGRAAASIRNPKPVAATSQPVMVVPTLAPNSTHSAWLSVSRPALTKPIAATVTALDDCTSEVIRMPAARPRRRVLVERARMRSSAGPAASCRPSVSSHMPSRKRPMPPAMLVRFIALSNR